MLSVKTLRACLFSALLPFGVLAGGHAAFASDPIPGDEIAPPPNVNIGLFYNIFGNAGTFGAVRGNNYSKDTHISTNINVLRYVRTMEIGGFLSGFQVYEPYVDFVGGQQLGVRNIGGPFVPALGGQLPAYGAGRANLSHTSGFGQPNFSVFTFPINDPKTGTYLTLVPWISPPIGQFNSNSVLVPAQNVWTYELSAGFRTDLFGTPSTNNLAVVVWAHAYFYGDNNKSSYVQPSVSANAIPSIYQFFNLVSGGQIPDANPLQAASSAPATFKEQPSGEFRVYFPYTFYPATDATITPGIYQSFGGKQTYTLHRATVVNGALVPAGTRLDSGNRTDETQLRLFVESFVSPTAAVNVGFYYDVAAHGQPLNRQLLIRLVKFF